MKRILSAKKTTLSSLKNQDWRTLESETEKVNDLLTNISTNNITKLNNLIYEGAKLVCEKIGVPLKTTDRKSKPRWEFSLESLIRKLTHQAKLLKRNMKIFSDEMEKVQQKGKVQLGETNKKKLAKAGRLQRYRDRTKQYKQNRAFQNNERKFYQKVVGRVGEDKPYNGCERCKKFLCKIRQPKDHNIKAQWINNVETELQMLEGDPEAEIHLDALKAILKFTDMENPWTR